MPRPWPTSTSTCSGSDGTCLISPDINLTTAFAGCCATFGRFTRKFPAPAILLNLARRSLLSFSIHNELHQKEITVSALCDSVVPCPRAGTHDALPTRQLAKSKERGVMKNSHLTTLTVSLILTCIVGTVQSADHGLTGGALRVRSNAAANNHRPEVQTAGLFPGLFNVPAPQQWQNSRVPAGYTGYRSQSTSLPQNRGSVNGGFVPQSTSSCPGGRCGVQPRLMNTPSGAFGGSEVRGVNRPLNDWSPVTRAQLPASGGYGNDWNGRLDNSGYNSLNSNSNYCPNGQCANCPNGQCSTCPNGQCGTGNGYLSPAASRVRSGSQWQPMTGPSSYYQNRPAGF